MTFYVYIIYFKQNQVIPNINYSVISEYENQDASGIHPYNKKMMEFLKGKFGAPVKEIYNCSDEAGS